MEVDLDKLIATWEHMIASSKLSKEMEAIILRTLQVLKRARDGT